MPLSYGATFAAVSLVRTSSLLAKKLPSPNTTASTASAKMGRYWPIALARRRLLAMLGHQAVTPVQGQHGQEEDDAGAEADQRRRLPAAAEVAQHQDVDR